MKEVNLLIFLTLLETVEHKEKYQLFLKYTYIIPEVVCTYILGEKLRVQIGSDNSKEVFIVGLKISIAIFETFTSK